MAHTMHPIWALPEISCLLARQQTKPAYQEGTGVAHSGFTPCCKQLLDGETLSERSWECFFTTIKWEIKRDQLKRLPITKMTELVN